MITDQQLKNSFGRGFMGTHEALHMASVLGQCVSDHLTKHPAVAAKPEWRKLSLLAEEALAELYQLIGAEHFGKVDGNVQ